MNATKLLNDLFNAGIVISIAATVLSLGMSFTVAQVLAPLRRVSIVVIMVVLNAAVIPAAAWGIARAFSLSDAATAGLTLAAIGAGSAASLKAAQLARRADLPLAVSVVVVVQLVNIAAVPLWAGAVVSGASISIGDIVSNLIALVLAPLAIGLVIRARYFDHATRWQPELVRIANLALVIALAAGISVNWDTITSLFGSRVLVASVVVIVVALGVGYLVGLRDAKTRTTTALVTGMRFGSLGLIVIGT